MNSELMRDPVVVEVRPRIRVASVAELQEQVLLHVEVHGERIALCYAEGRVWAVSGMCPHQNKPLDDAYIVRRSIICPLHGARFDLATGECLRKPADDPLETFAVLEENGEIYLELEIQDKGRVKVI